MRKELMVRSLCFACLALLLSGCGGAMMRQYQEETTRINALPPSEQAIAYAERSLRLIGSSSPEQAYRNGYMTLKRTASQLAAAGNQVELEKLRAFFNARPDFQQAARQYNIDFLSLANIKAIADSLQNDRESLRRELDLILAGQAELLGLPEVEPLHNKIRMFLGNKISVQIASRTWAELGVDERLRLNSEVLVEILPSGGLATIIDVQTVDKSTGATVGGAVLGAAVASAAYRDNAFKGAPREWNYSAKGQLAAEVVGAMIGSSFDSQATNLFLHRYTLKNLEGAILYHETHAFSSMRHTSGLCIFVPKFDVVNQNLCTEDASGFKKRLALIQAEAKL